MKISPYLTFNGDCKQALTFYAEVLGAKIEMMTPFSAAPKDALKVPDEAKDQIMHAELLIDGQLLMASDTMPGQPYKTSAGYSVTIVVSELDEAKRIFAALAKGGDITMDLQETFWTSGFGSLTDRFGIPWMINVFKPDSA